MFINEGLLSLTLGALLMLGSASAARAKDRACFAPIHRERRELRRAIDRYGFDGPEEF